MRCGWSWAFSKWYLLRAFQRAQTITVHSSSSCWFSLVVMVRNNSKKSDALFEHFWIRLPANAQTFLAKGHSQSTCQVVSMCWVQNSHLSSTLTFRRCKLSFVGKIFEQALHRRDRTLGGTFSFHTFQILPFCRACECSPWGWYFRLSSLSSSGCYFPSTLIHHWNADCSEEWQGSLFVLMEQTELESFHGPTA